MIEIGLTQAIVLYSLAIAIVVGGIWIYTEVSVRRPQRTLGKQFLWHCSFCGCSYLDESASKLSQCPQCNSYNALETHDSPNEGPGDRKGHASEEVGEQRRNASHRKRHHQRTRGPRRRR